MSNKGRTRVVNAHNAVSNLVPYGENFRIGLAFDDDLIKSTDLDKFGLAKIFDENISQLPKAAGARSRANRKGHWVRKHPPEKTELKRHIKYKTKRGDTVEYDRVYNIYKKILIDKLGIELAFVNHDTAGHLIASPLLMNDDEQKNQVINAHVINLFLEIFKDFEILRENYEYYFKAEEEFNDVILPEGSLTDPRIFGDFVNVVSAQNKEADREPTIKRLDVFKEFKAVLKTGKGINGYAIIEFEDKDIVAAESLKHGHATYFFNKKDYEETVVNNKQNVINNELAIRRFYHTDGWERNVRGFINKH